MSDHGGLSAGEIGGIFAGVTALLIAIGHGLKWLFNWNDARANSRAAKLQAWHDELATREARLDHEINGRLTALEAANRTLAVNNETLMRQFDRSRMAYRVIAAELVAIAPHSAALVAAQAILNEALPVSTAAEDRRAVDRIDAADQAAHG